MIVEREDIHEALDEWLKLGFSQESLGILKERLYDRVECLRKGNIDREDIDKSKGLKDVNKHSRLFKNLYYRLLLLYRGKILGGRDGEYVELNSSDKHVIWLKEPSIETIEYEGTIKYHEIKHCAIREFFNLLLDKKSDLYKGLDNEEVKKRILNAYEISKSSLCTRSMRFQIKVNLTPKETRDKWKLINEIDNYSGDKTEIITKNRYSLGNTFSLILHNNLVESSCNDERSTKEFNGCIKNNLLKLLTSISLSIYVYFLDLPNEIKSLYSLLALMPAYLYLSRYSNIKNYGDFGIRKRLEENIQDIKDPYGQFLGFITTK